MRAFVGGATGWTGRFVVEALAGCGVETFAHVRPDSGRIEEWRARVSALGGETDTTPWTAQAMGERMHALRPDLVFGLLGTTRARAAAGDGDYEAVDHDLTVMLLEACDVPGNPRFVYLSSLGSSADARGAYLKTRWRVEEAIRDRGMPALIVRPSLIVGDRDTTRWGETIGAWLLDVVLKPLRWVGSSRIADRYGSIHGRDLARGMVAHALRTEEGVVVVDSSDVRPDRAALPVGRFRE